jgi:hypothetical protein
LVNSARYCVPDWADRRSVRASWVVVAPGIWVQVTPPSPELDHCTLGSGSPEAAAVKLAVPPASPLLLLGEVTTRGAAGRTVSVTMPEFDVPVAFVYLTTYCSPFWAYLTAGSVRFGLVAPGTAVKVGPPVTRYHCAVGAGLPVALEVKVADSPAVTVVSCGMRPMEGDTAASTTRL